MRKFATLLVIGVSALALSTGTANATVVRPCTPKIIKATPESDGWGAWKPVPTSVEQAIGHKDCIWLIGGTTYIVCKDGFMESS